MALLIVATSLISTIVIELGVLYLLKERRKKVLLSSVIINILTNVPLNMFVLFINGSLRSVLIGEVIVLVVETIWYRMFVGNMGRAFFYSALCNAISFLLGVLVQLLWMACKLYIA